MNKKHKTAAFGTLAAVLVLGLIIETAIETRKPDRQTESVRPALSEGGVFAESDSILKDLENARVGESAAETLIGENETAEAVDGEETSNTKPEPETERSGVGADTGVEGGATSNQVEPKKPGNKNPEDKQDAPETGVNAPAGKIVAVGYIDIDGVMVGPESLGDERKCGPMSEHPEITVWYRYANGAIRGEKRKFLNHSGTLLDKTRSGEPLPYLLYIDHSSLNLVGYDEELKKGIYETNLWVKCAVYQKYSTGPIDEPGLDS